MPDVVRIEGMDKLLRKMKTIEQLRGARRGLKAGALHIKGKINVYPPSTIANSPGNPTGRWYERGYGTRWITSDGRLGGRKTSETLGRRWTIDERNAGMTQVIGNNVSYGPYVQSDEHQASFHAARGWMTDKEAVEQEGPTVLRFVKDEVDRELRQE